LTVSWGCRRAGGGLRRYRATVNNDGVAVLIWELAPNNPSNGEFAA